MSKNSFLNLKKIFKKKGFKFRDFEVSSIGDYLPDDADWNYKDVHHLNIVHKTVHGVQAVMTDDVMCNINLQKIPILGFEIPMPLIQYDHSKHNAIYLSVLGPYIVLINSIFEKFNETQTNVITKFSIGSKGIFRVLNPIIEHLLKKNNKMLMNDDLPMRNRRGELRKINHLFYKNTERYSFEFSENIERANVFLNEEEKNIINIEKKIILEAKDGDIVGNINGVLSFFVTVDNEGVKSVWPTTCSHEGAKLSNKCLKTNFLLCPWHNRKVNSLLSIKDGNIKIKPTIHYAVKVMNDKIGFKYRNDPKYYENKPFEYLKYDD